MPNETNVQKLFYHLVYISALIAAYVESNDQQNELTQKAAQKLYSVPSFPLLLAVVHFSESVYLQIP